MNTHDKINRLIDKIEAIPAMDFAGRAKGFHDLRAAIEADRLARGESVCGAQINDNTSCGEQNENHAPQPQQIPEPHPWRESMSSNHRSYAEGWNACRKAMLEAAPEPEGEV